MAAAAAAAASDSDYEGSELDAHTTADGPVVGIDLGTTYSCVGVYRNGRVEIIPNEMNKNTTPSFVSFDSESGERFVGHDAKEQNRKETVVDAGNTIFDVKRLIGRNFRDTEVQSDLKNWPFKVVDGNPHPLIQVVVNNETQTHTPESISGLVLLKMKQVAEDHLNQRITKAVITVPAYFNDGQRKATADAASAAGLMVMRMINEPTAAAIAYAMDYVKEKKQRNILVYDLGGGTFDVTILQIKGHDFVVKASNGNTHLGGTDFDSLLVEYFKEQLMQKYGQKYDMTSSPAATTRLRLACENAKIQLSVDQETQIDLPNLIHGQDLSATLTRSQFEEICFQKFQDTIEPIEKVVKDAGMTFDSIDDLVLVGGSTRIPRIQQMVRDMFQKKELARDINPDEAVCYGAVLMAGLLSEDDEEVGEIAPISVTDVCPLSLGIRIQGGFVDVLVPRNTQIPCEKYHMFSTTKDNQTKIRVTVVQGERPLAHDNHQLGQFVLKGIRKQPKGKPRIRVTLIIDENGILSAISRDEETNSTEELVIRNSCHVPEKKMIQMMEAAKQFQHLDQEVRERIFARNELHAIIMKEKSSAQYAIQMAKMLIWWERNASAADLQQLEQMTDLVTRLLTLDEDSCLHLHDCLHICCGIRGERICMSCLFCSNTADTACPVCMDDLSSAPCIQLNCKHVIHSDCCKDMIRRRFPGPAITFNFANCPFGCDNVEMEHESLTGILKPIRDLKEQVMRKAGQRLVYEKMDKDPAIIRPNGRYYKNPTGFALTQFAYYECSRCQKPYFGGRFRCEAQNEDQIRDQEFDPNTLLCGSCSGGAGAAVCGKHDSDYSGYKCRYCCSMAVYFCFGTTHFCATCHDNHARLRSADVKSLPQCPVGPGCKQLPGKECPLRIQHPPTGQEYYLGCSICMNVSEM